MQQELSCWIYKANSKARHKNGGAHVVPHLLFRLRFHNPATSVAAASFTGVDHVWELVACRGHPGVRFNKGLGPGLILPGELQSAVLAFWGGLGLTVIKCKLSSTLCWKIPSYTAAHPKKSSSGKMVLQALGLMNLSSRQTDKIILLCNVIGSSWSPSKESLPCRHQSV